MTLRGRDIWPLLEATEIIHAHGEETFAKRLSRATERLFPGSAYALDVFGDDGGHDVETDVPFDPRVDKIAREGGPQILFRDHPMAGPVLAGTANVQRLSELTSTVAFRETELFNFFYKPVDVRFQAIVPVRVHTGHGALTFNRADRDLTDRELLLAVRFGRQVERAYMTDRILAGTNGQAREEDEGAFHGRIARRGITRRESTILYWVVQGKRNAEIAIILGISSRTVETHLANAYRKLGVEGRAAAIMELVR